MSLSSSSTLDDAVGQYLDNLSWEGDIAKARLFLAAIRAIRGLRGQGITSNNRTVNYASLDPDFLRVQAFVQSVDGMSVEAKFTRGVPLR
jgi:hypothetical protein